MEISAIKQFLDSAICDYSAYLNLGHRVSVMRSLLDSFTQPSLLCSVVYICSGAIALFGRAVSSASLKYISE